MLNLVNGFLLYSNLLDRLSKTHVITGLVLAVLGFALALLARRITSVARKKEDRALPVENNNKVYLTLKALGLVFLLVALIILMFE